MSQIQVYETIRKKLGEIDSTTKNFMYSDFVISNIEEFPQKNHITVDETAVISNLRFLNTVCEQGEYSYEVVQMNEIVGDTFSVSVKKKYKLNILKWEPNKQKYPKYMLLGSDKGILAYIEFFYHQFKSEVEKDCCFQYGICHEFDEVVRRIQLVDSDLDRPVFYIHYVDYPEIKGIFFETTEVIKDCLLTKSNPIITRQGKRYYFSSLLEMGCFDELMEILSDLKKNNVNFN